MQSSGNKRVCVKHCFIPQRYLTAIMINLGIITGYLIRRSGMVVLRHITKPENKTHTSELDNWCNFTNIDRKKFILDVDELYDWDNKMTSQIRHMFYYGYLFGHFPGGYISDKYGGKNVLAASILGPGILSMLTPLIITRTKSYVALTVLRFLSGTLQGAMFPAANNLISMWTPRREISGIAGIVFAASQLATFINNLCTEDLMKTAWPNVFYAYGSLAVAWTCLWMLIGHSNYTTNPFINDDELRYLKKELKSRVFYKKESFPWTMILGSLPVWALMVAQVGHVWIWYSLNSEFPTFVKQILRFNVKSSHLLSSLPYGILVFLTIAEGFIADIIINGRYADKNDMRRIFTTLGAMGPGIFILAAAYCGCNRKASIYMFCIAFCLNSFYYIGTRIISLDLAPNYSGSVMALVNGLGSIPGVIHKQVYGQTEYWPLHEWRKLFYVYLIVLACTNIFFVLFGTSNQQSWNNWENEQNRKNSKDIVEQSK